MMNFIPQQRLAASSIQEIHRQSVQIAINRGESFRSIDDLISADSRDERKLWRLLLRSAIRSFGPANTALVGRCSELASGTRARQRAREADAAFITKLTIQLNSSPLSGLCHRAHVATRAVQEGTLSRRALPTRLVFDLSETWQAARPIRLSNGVQVLSASGRRHLPDLWHSQEHDATVISMVMGCLSRSGDLSAVFLPWSMRQLDCQSTQVQSQLVPSEDIHGFMSYGLNGQTEVGRASLALYLANSKAMQVIIPRTRSPDRAVWLVSQIVKRVEADPISEELVPSELTRLSDIASDTIDGLDRQRAREARAILTDEIGLLNACRQEVMSHVR